MTDELDKILHRTNQYYQAVALGRTPPNKTDFATAKQAIQAYTKRECNRARIELELKLDSIYTVYRRGNFYDIGIQERIAELTKDTK